jgi:aldoxime dehydratase
MESAIPEHLRCPRTRESRASETYRPPNPAYCARLDPATRRIVMACYGAQYRAAEGRQCARQGLLRLAGAAGASDGPVHQDLAFTIDAQGYDTILWVAYWSDVAAFERWRAGAAVADWWNDDARLHDPCGWFLEVALPTAEHLETLSSTPEQPEGLARLAPRMSGEVREHAYWGGMRDRLAIAQTDALHAGPPPARAVPGRRVVLPGAHNAALIRSGQDWSRTQDEERRLYLQQIEPRLREGMDYLRDHGAQVGCLANRYLVRVDQELCPLEHSYGLSWWRDLEHMERWSHGHPTHLEIFGAFMRIVKQMDFRLDLRLYHEVSVLRAEDQYLEYVNCHPQTGLLGGVPGLAP